MQVQLTPGEVRKDTGEPLAPTREKLAREGARRTLAVVLEREFSESVNRHQARRDGAGLRQVVRNGRAQLRKVTIGGMAVLVQAPRVHDRRTGEQFRSQILPPFLRRRQRLDQALPVL